MLAVKAINSRMLVIKMLLLMMTRVVNKVHIFKEQVLQRNRRLGGQLEAKEIIIGSKLLMILIQMMAL